MSKFLYLTAARRTICWKFKIIPRTFKRRKTCILPAVYLFMLSSSSLFPPVPKGETSGFSAEGLIQPSFFRAQTNSELCHRETVVVDGAGSRRFHYLTPQHLFYPVDMMRPLLARRRQLERKNGHHSIAFCSGRNIYLQL